MSDRLDGARFKIVRAQEHVNALKAEITMYLDQRPYEIPREKTGDAPFWGPTITILPPLRLSAIIGDCVTNVRAALDYIIWELAARYFCPPFDETDFHDRRITSFPISKGAADRGYVDRLNRLANRKLPAAAIDEIKAVQPYNRGYEPLWWLHTLVNTDKHRMLILTLSYVPFFAWWEDEHGGIHPAAHWGPDRNPPTGAELLAMRVKHQVNIFVTFQDVSMPREPVDRTLEQIIEAAANIIPRFEVFLV